MTTPAASPLPRIGDAERDDAVSLLQEHMAAGRLDQTEFTDRMNTALTARTRADLDPLFTDLPGRLPGQQVTAAPTPHAAMARPTPAQPARSQQPSSHRTLMLVVLGVIALGVLVALSAAGWQHWWLFVMIPIFFSFGGHRRRGGCGRRR